jgi:hypothetical protein
VPVSVLDVVRRRGPELGYLILVDIGYNDVADGYADGIDEVMRALAAAGVERVVWITLRESQASWAAISWSKPLRFRL